MAKYEMIENDLKEKITYKEYALGERIPSELELSNMYGVSRITAKRALNDLESAGYIKRVSGKGSFVCYHPIHHLMTGYYSLHDEIIRSGRTPTSIMLDFKDIKITHLPMHTTVMHELDLFDYDHVFYLRRLRYADDELLALDQTYIPSKYAPELKAEYFAQNNVSLFHVLQDKIHITPNRAQESFSVCSVSAEDAKDHRVAPRSPALVNTRISYLNGNPIEYNYRICKGESYQYSVNLEMR